jgi:hypothetical protein
VHEVLFAVPPARKAVNVKEGIRKHIRQRYARD